jgi:TonB family protein
MTTGDWAGSPEDRGQPLGLVDSSVQMPNTPVYASDSALLAERRVHVRHTLNVLAYIDVGTDNGGIVLNLSEDGMGFQAVGPLDGQREVSLRIQLPHSKERIETAAKVVWLSESNRQAGVQFLDMPAAACGQIHEWIRSQMPYDAGIASVVEPLAPHEVAKEPPQKSEPIHQTRTDKWLSLMADLQAPVPEEVKPVPAASTSSTTISLQELSARLQASQTAEQNEAEPAKPISSAIPPASIPEQVTPSQSSIEPPKSAPLGRSEPADLRRAPVTDQTMKNALPKSRPAAARSTLTMPSQLFPPVKQAGPLEISETRVDSAPPIPESTLPAAPVVAAAPARNSNLKWAAAAAAFVLFSVLCFAVGAWVGSLGTAVPQPPSEASANAPSLTTSGSGEVANPAVTGVVPTTTGKTHAGQVSANSAPENRNRKPSPPANRADVLAVRQNLPLPASKQNPVAVQAPLTAMNAPSRAGTSVPITTATKPPEKGISSAPAPASDSDAAAASSPNVVAGRVLRPTDRFIPCHLTYRVEPIYPEEAKQNGIEGAVKIHLSVTPDGSVENVKLVSGPPLLALAALDAAQYWRYMPALLNGQPIETEQDIEITFRLPR